jgi:hypothetical protein
MTRTREDVGKKYNADGVEERLFYEGVLQAVLVTLPQL